MKVVIFFLKLIISFFVFTSFLNGQVSLSPDAAITFKVNEVLNSSSGNTAFDSRRIYILLEEKDFTIENLKRMFEFLSNKYPVPKLLNIKVFSDSKRLKQMIDYDNPGFSISFADTKAGKKAQKKFDEERYPKLKGFYAEYYKDAESESFDYNPVKDVNKLVRIKLKVKSKVKANDKRKFITKT